MKISSLLPLILILPQAALATVTNPAGGGTTPLFTSMEGATGLACTILDWMFTGAMIFGVAMVLFAAFKYMTGGADSKKVTEAHNAVLYAAVGIAVAILAKGVPQVVASLLGAKLPGAC